MSYMRQTYPLKWFKGKSQIYVWPSVHGVEDHDEEYEHLPSLVELIGTFIERETGDEKYADKMVKVLSSKLGITGELRKRVRYDL